MMRLVLVTAPDCHLCDQARRVLAKLGPELAIHVEHVDWDDPRAADLRRDDPPPFPPALYRDGRLVAYGRLSEAALRRRLRLEAGA